MTLQRFNGLEAVISETPGSAWWEECHIKIETLDPIFSIQIPDENCWDDTPEELIIYKGKDGFGIFHEIPDGYSEYTYDPYTIKKYYQNCDWDWFFNFGLDQSQRDLLNGFKP